jgi:hypothetical protein
MADEQAVFLTDGMDDVLTKPLARNTSDDTVDRYSKVGRAARAPTSPIVDLVLLRDLSDALGRKPLETVLERFSGEILNTLEFFNHGVALPLGVLALRDALNEIEDAAGRGDTGAVTQAVRHLPAVWSAMRPRLTLRQDQAQVSGEFLEQEDTLISSI